MITDVETKLNNESKQIKDRYCKVMMEDVRAALMEFCRQSEEFCRAVEQGGSFADCMMAVAKNCGQSLSDLEAYRRAVSFYFPTATISFEMRINTEGNNALEADNSDNSSASTALTMSLDDLLGM